MRVLHISKSDASRRWIRVAMFALTLWSFAEASSRFNGPLVALQLRSSKACKVHVDRMAGTQRSSLSRMTRYSIVAGRTVS